MLRRSEWYAKLNTRSLDILKWDTLKHRFAIPESQQEESESLSRTGEIRLRSF